MKKLHQVQLLTFYWKIAKLLSYPQTMPTGFRDGCSISRRRCRCASAPPPAAGPSSPLSNGRAARLRLKRAPPPPPAAHRPKGTRPQARLQPQRILLVGHVAQRHPQIVQRGIRLKKVGDTTYKSGKESIGQIGWLPENLS